MASKTKSISAFLLVAVLLLGSFGVFVSIANSKTPETKGSFDFVEVAESDGKLSAEQIRQLNNGAMITYNGEIYQLSQINEEHIYAYNDTDNIFIRKYIGVNTEDGFYHSWEKTNDELVTKALLNSALSDYATDNDVKLSYHDTTLKVLQADGTYEFVNIPLSNYGDWANSYGKDWSILALNTKDNVVFGSAGDVARDSLYGYFYVSVFKEQVKNLDELFAGYTADGCRSFYDCKKVVGSDLYKKCNEMGTLGTILCLGANKIIQAAAEFLHEDYGTYYSYFLFVDGSSTLTYSSNNKADNYFDHSSAIDNTFENVGDSFVNWLDDNFGKLKSVFVVVGSILLVCFVAVSISKIIANIGSTGKYRRRK